MTLKTYNFSRMIPLGILEVHVRYKDYMPLLKLPIYILNNERLPIICREWLTKLNILPKYLDYY